MAKSPGKQFEEDIEKSCKDQNIHYDRKRDVFIPVECRNKIKIPQNKYDTSFFKTPFLLPIEMKSTKSKSISMQESVIKAHQIEHLKKENNFEENIISGFIFNFREYDNQTFFVHIDDFITYKNVAEGKDKNTTHQSKVNKSSIPLDICKEIGIEISNTRKKVHYRYYINKLINNIKDKYKDKLK